ncbi:hypothetical protein NQ176_g3256 [Zarea fungicola]|uniref:Uncharacterized protein n=1 Tax=Zarea fungicola TaxID=93591 RepID=A0ACC1NKP8_9HYPO|nr:hypothetical protein NQ176_g3256 [Lecanicillium fungicola]
MRGPRLQVGSTPWIAEERSSALQIVQSEVEEFSFSARNEMEWLNEHMAGIFDENETNFADVFKTPGKLRGKTPRTARKAVVLADTRVPLSDVFTTTPNGAPPQQLSKLLSPKQISRSSKPLVATSKPMPQSQSTQDSGYYGSQDIDIAPASIYNDLESSSQKLHTVHHMTTGTKQCQSQIPFTGVSDQTFQPPKEEQPRQTTNQAVFSDVESSPMRHNMTKPFQSSSPLKHVPLKSPILHSDLTDIADANEAAPEPPSEASSPIRQVVRKSSLNFASLPAREPLAPGKSVGRVSRVSHLEKPIAAKSLGHTARAIATDDENYSDLDVDDDEEGPPKESTGEAARNSKTYTQRLQDQINQLGKSNSTGLPQSRSFAIIPAVKQNTVPASHSDSSLTVSPTRKHSISKVLQTTPGAFPEDEDDEDWIEPPSAAPMTEARPALPKSHSADVMQGIQGKSTIGQPEFADQNDEHAIRLQTHGKSASVSTLPSMKLDSNGDLTLVKTAPVSNGLSTVEESQGLETPYGSPSRLFRDSPLKQMKSKLSSIFKGSKSLLASSAAISAEGKSLLLTPSTAYLGMHPSPSSTSLALKPRIASDASLKNAASMSPPKTRRTRASAEREREDKRREKEAKLMAEQMDRLDKAREKEREKARVFSKEQERITAMEREIVVKKQEEQMHAKQTPKVPRASPRKIRSDDEARSEDVEMTDEMQVVPPSAARPTGTTHSLRNRDVKRPAKPTKEDSKAKQAPTVIRVKPGSQHSQFHQAGRPSANPQDHTSTSGSQPQLSTKASQVSLHSKASSQSLKSSTSTRPKAPEAATKKKEAEEREAQKRRDAKLETERKRAASQEEQRQI